MIKAVSADDAQAYIGVYRNGTWENTQVVGITAPGFSAGNNLNLQAINVRAGNSAGQFVFDTLIYMGASFTGVGAAYMGQNGTLQLMMKTGDILPGNPRAVQGTFRTGSINNSGTVAISGAYSGVEGFVYRWSAVGGASKVISHGDPIPSIGPNASFYGLNGFQSPLINDSGAVLFLGEVQLDGPNSSNSLNRSSTLLYQSAPGAPVVKVAMSGDTINGLAPGTVALFGNSDDLNFNDAGQIAFVCVSLPNSTAAGRSGGSSTIISGGTAPNISVIAREGTPVPIDGLSGSRTFTGLTRPLNGTRAGSASTRVAGEFGAFLSNQGEIAFRGVLPGGFFGFSTVFQARLNELQTSPLAVQTITFPQPFNRTATAGTLTLTATSSSGLPVTYTVVSGPATLAGNILSFTGATGDVLMRATQAGNASFLAAETIDRTIKVSSNTNDLPPAGSAVPSSVMLPLTPAPGGTLYSGALTPGFIYPGLPDTFISSDTNSNSSRIFADGTINFKDALTDDIITTSTSPVRLNFSSSTTTGVSTLPGEVLDSSTATVMGILPTNQIVVRAFLRPRNSLNSEKIVIAVGPAGNFTKILQTGDVLPGTTSIYTNTSIFASRLELPAATRGGLPWVLATATNGLSNHIGIYRNGAWETTQILGRTPPGGYSAGTKFNFLQSQFTVANPAGEFFFKSEVVNSSNVKVGGGFFYGKNGTLSLVGYDGTPLAGDTRQTLTLDCRSSNSNGEAAFYGTYRAVSGNPDQGGFVHRWSSTGGFTSVLKRGDFLPFLGANVIFDFPQRAPIISDTGALVMLAQIADRNPATGVLSNRRLALLHQASNNSAVEKILVTGELVAGAPAGFGNLLAGSLSGISFVPTAAMSLQISNSGHIAIFARVGVTGFGGPNIVYGGTLPNLSFIMRDGVLNIDGLGTRSGLFTALSENVDGATGDPGSSLSNAGDFVFRGSYSNIGNSSNSGVFKASVIPPPIIPVPQTLTFTAPADRIINSTAFNPGATSDSGLAVTYQIISGPAVVSGNSLTPGATTGLVIVSATQSGNVSFLAATPVDRSFRLVENASELAMSQYLATANVPPANRLATLDLDNDGLVNLLEFALGGNPLLPDSQKLPTAQVVSGVLRFTYSRAQTASVVYTVKTSADLAALWNATGVNQGNPDLNGLTTATLPLTSGTGGFLRLEVNLAP